MKDLINKINKWFHTKDGVVQTEINKQLITIVVSVFVTVLSVIGVTYSAFLWSDNSLKNQNIVVGNVELAISSSSGALGSSLNYPVAEADVASLEPYTFTITNAGSLSSKYKVKIATDEAFTNTLDTKYIYMSVDGGATITSSPLSDYIDVPIDIGTLKPGGSKTYNLRLWIVETAPNEVIGQEWHGKIVLDAEQVQLGVNDVDVDVTFEDGSDTITASNMSPITNSEVLTSANKKTFTINKSTDTDTYATIRLTDITISEVLAKYDFKWALYQGTNKITTGDFGGKTSEDIILATNELITANTDYSLYVWINETGLDQSALENQTFKATISVIGNKTKLNTLASVILGENNANVTTTAPTFTTTSTDKGLFVQQGDTEKSEMGFPTYYYRGSVTNNYVKFGTYQTTDGRNTVGNPILWRIVRINEDGSIRLISENDVSDRVAFNSTGYSKYINDDGTDSEVKTAVETWYNSNIGNNSTLDNKVVTSSFCNDISGIDYDGSYSIANAYTRLYTSTPSPIYTCPAGAITAYEKVGMITADEMVYGGALYGKSVTNNTTYLYKSYYWTLTPYNYEGTIYWDFYSKYLFYANVGNDSKAASRAVINLSPDVTVTGGDGLSADTAFVVE